TRTGHNGRDRRHFAKGRRRRTRQSGAQGVAEKLRKQDPIMMSALQRLELLACFFVGAIPFAQVAMWGTGVDITKVGSKNPGFNNVLRVSTKPRALFALLGDISKGYIALLIFSSGPPESLQCMMGIAAVMGHCWNPFLRWNGGKGAATTAGVMLF